MAWVQKFKVLLCVLVWTFIGTVTAVRRHPNEAPLEETANELPHDVVDALRQVFQVPDSTITDGVGLGDKPRPSRYMVHLYKEVSRGHKKLPATVNTVRSYLPKSEGLPHDLKKKFLLYKVTFPAKEKVIMANLHLKAGHTKKALQVLPRARPIRFLFQIFEDFLNISEPSSIKVLRAGIQDLDVTDELNKLVLRTRSPRFFGVGVEELNRGVWTPASLRRWKRSSPLLVVYTSDPAILNLKALGIESLNLSSPSMAHFRRTFTGTRSKRAISPSGHIIDINLLEAEPERKSNFKIIKEKESNSLSALNSWADEEQNLLPLDLLRPHKPRRQKQKGLIPYPEGYLEYRRSQNRKKKRGGKKKKWKKKENNNEIAHLLTNELQGSLAEEGFSYSEPDSVCQRHELFLDFVKLGWDSFIVAPTGFSAYYCDGACPLSAGKATNHAVIQSLMRLLGHSKIPSPCCVPESLESLSLLSIRNEVLTLKNYPKMVVNSCSCQ